VALLEVVAAEMLCKGSICSILTSPQSRTQHALTHNHVHRCTTPVEHAPPQPVTSNLRIALQDFRLNPCTSRDVPAVTSTEVVTSKVDMEPKPTKLKGQKAIGDFFRRSDGVHTGEHHPTTSSEDARGAAQCADHLVLHMYIMSQNTKAVAFAHT
jgi:hypothetical protein